MGGRSAKRGGGVLYQQMEERRKQRKAVQETLWGEITGLIKDASFAQALFGQKITDANVATDLLHRMRHTRVLAAIALQVAHYTEVMVVSALAADLKPDMEKSTLHIHTRTCERLVAEYDKQGLKELFTASPVYTIVQGSRQFIVNDESSQKSV